MKKEREGDNHVTMRWKEERIENSKRGKTGRDRVIRDGE